MNAVCYARKQSEQFLFLVLSQTRVKFGSAVWITEDAGHVDVTAISPKSRECGVVVSSLWAQTPRDSH
jgi:hypothetical protein